MAFTFIVEVEKALDDKGDKAKEGLPPWIVFMVGGMLVIIHNYTTSSYSDYRK